MSKPKGSSTLYINIDSQSMKEFEAEAENFRLTRSSFFEVLWKFYKEKKGSSNVC